MKKMNTMTIFIAALLLAGIMAITSTMGIQLALADGNNNHNKLKINQDTNQNNKCKQRSEQKNSDENTFKGGNFACVNLGFNIVCLPNSVCILPSETPTPALVTPT
jgi:hypothetical protein